MKINKKIAVSIITLILILLVATSSLADSDVFIPTGLYPYKAQDGYYYFCAQKGGALRFFGNSKGEALIVEKSESSNDWTYRGTNIEGATTTTTYESNVTINNHIEHMIEEKMNNLIANLTGKNEAILTQDSEYSSWSDGFEGYSRTYNSDGKKYVRHDEKDENGKWKYANYVNKDGTASEISRLESAPLAATPTYLLKDAVENTAENNKIAYILSAGKAIPETKESAGKTNYNTESISDKTAELSEEDYLDVLQHALWKDISGFNEGKDTERPAKIGDNDKPGQLYDMGVDLYNESLEYEKYYKNNLANYKVSFKDIKPIVIANKDEKAYIVGPFVLNYPDNGFYSYIKEMKITDQDGKNATNDFTFIKESGDRKYPDSGKGFYIKVSADKVNNWKGLQLHVKFNYLSKTYAKYYKLKGEGNLYQNKVSISIGIQDCESKPNDPNATPEWIATGEYSKVVSETVRSGTELKKTASKHVTDNGKEYMEYTDYTDEKYNPITKKYTYTKTVYRAPAAINRYYVTAFNGSAWREQMMVKDENGNNTSIPQVYNAQTAAKVIKTEREWTPVDITTSTIDLRTQIAGKVFLDKESGKETLGNGICDDNEKGIRNIEVILHCKNEKEIVARTTTSSNGKYKFTGLDAMKDYYVEFKYNGQYFQPTYYTSPDIKTDRKKNSNATEKSEDRTAMNNKFASIGSAPENYVSSVNDSGNNVYGQTYTKLDLMGYVLQSDGTYKFVENKQVIERIKICDVDDKNHEHNEKCYVTNGELIKPYRDGVNPKDPDMISKINFVKDCKISAWTKGVDNLDFENADFVYREFDYYNSDKTVINHNDNNENLGVYYTNSDLSSYNNLYNLYLNYAQSITAGNKEFNKSRREDKSQYINLGLMYRPEFDLTLTANVSKVELLINNKEMEYEYPERTTTKDDLNIDVRLSDGYYTKDLSREIYPSDYLFDVETYYGKNNLEKLQKSKENELKVFVTYKVKVMNTGLGNIKGKFDEIVFYYDEDYDFVEESATVQYGENKTRKINASSDTIYSENTKANINGFNKLYITDPKNIDTDSGNDKYIIGSNPAYITLKFEVRKDDNGRILLDEVVNNGEFKAGKECIAEINGYSTIYGDEAKIPTTITLDENGNKVYGDKTVANTKAGILDIDSNPGNLNTTSIKKDDNKFNYTLFEDDTDKTQNLYIVLKRDGERIISGYTWEDNRTLVNDDQKTVTGNGEREDSENFINGITVQLVEITNGQEYVWREFGSTNNGHTTVGNGTGTGTQDSVTPIINENNLVPNYNLNKEKGSYAFTSFIPGDYIVRFKYGDRDETVLTSDNTNEVNKLLNKNGLNAKSYNGQDYKSTLYQVELNTYKNNKELNSTGGYLKEYKYDIEQGDTQANISDAKDLYDVRENVIKYSNMEITNAKAENLVCYKNVPTVVGEDKDKMQAELNKFIAGTAMTAETGLIDIGVEYNQTKVAGQGNNNKFSYHLQNLNLGLEERPKAQIEINKDVERFTITLANGTILFDSDQKVQPVDNLLWIKNPMDGQYTKEGLMMRPKPRKNEPREYGTIQATMDKEIMHGAVVKVVYKITVKNIGEVDYKEQGFYYTGKVNSKNNIVTTTPTKIVDYVPNNMKYYDADNNITWNVVTAKDLCENKDYNVNLVNNNLKEQVGKVETIVTSDKINKKLVPEFKDSNEDNNSSSVFLTLTQTLSPDNTSDSMVYNNLTELLAYKNKAGRRMEYSIVGNQDPTAKEPAEIAEIDADIFEIMILPPFGANLKYIIISIITIAGASIVIAGIVFIKKKVLEK